MYSSTHAEWPIKVLPLSDQVHKLLIQINKNREGKRCWQCVRHFQERVQSFRRFRGDAQNHRLEGDSTVDEQEQSQKRPSHYGTVLQLWRAAEGAWKSRNCAPSLSKLDFLHAYQNQPKALDRWKIEGLFSLQMKVDIKAMNLFFPPAN